MIILLTILNESLPFVCAIIRVGVNYMRIITITITITQRLCVVITIMIIGEKHDFDYDYYYRTMITIMITITFCHGDYSLAMTVYIRFLHSAANMQGLISIIICSFMHHF